MSFDYGKLKALENLIKQSQFVPMDPAAMGGMPPPGDPAMGGMPPAGDPAMGGMPPGGDPAMGGMPPAGDPAMGGMPPAGDPAMAGLPPGLDLAALGGMPPAGDPMGGATSGDVSPSGEPYMKITPTQLSKLFKQFAEVFKSVLGVQSTPEPQTMAQPSMSNPQHDAQLAELNAKLDAIIQR